MHLHSNYEQNLEKIAKLEKKLATVNDKNLQTKIQDLKAFEILNAEKMSPHFLNLQKKTGNSELPINCIKDDSNNLCSGYEELDQHVTNFYTDLYRKDPEVRGTIEDFLGENISSSPLVRDSKLTQVEKDDLDKPLTREELDSALESSNFKSAPGRDGFSYRIIKLCWKFFRVPLLECAQEGLENNSLPELFKEADIKIIPKKGDISSIKTGDR